MAGISRRELLSSGLALSVSSLVARSAWGRAAAMLAGYSGAASGESLAAMAPREQLLFDFGWKFQFGHGTDPARDLGFGNGQGDFAKTGDFAFAKAEFDDSKWRALNLPHDWAVELPFVRDEVQNSHGYKPLGRRYPETSVGWYRREFEIPASDLGRRITVEFDGAFRDVLVFVNGCFIGRNDNGYAPFRFDLTDFLSYGAKNYIVARVDASFGDGWFYEGAGIYRHVWLTKTDALHLGKWESTVRTELNGNSATLTLGTVVVNEGKQAENAKVSWQILDAAGKTVATAEAPAQSIAGGWYGKLYRHRQAGQSGAVVGGCAEPLLGHCDRGGRRQGARCRAGELWRAHGGLRRRQGLLPQRQAAEDSGHLQPPGPRRRGRGLAGPLAVVPAGRAAARWAAMRCAPRTICRRRSGWRPATAWA